MNLIALAALTDNYIWILEDTLSAWVVDPGDAVPVLEHLDRHGLVLGGILVTHHHADHVGGINALCKARASDAPLLCLPAADGVPQAAYAACAPERVRLVHEGDVMTFPGFQARVLDVPGHTAGHVAYVCTFDAPASRTAAPVLFCGDTLFSAGCRRLFEGTAAQMLASLQKLAALPPDTRVCPAHEYTLANLRFARVVEPGNPLLLAHAQTCEALRARGLPTLPSTVSLERAINPFLRTGEPEVLLSVQRHAHAPGAQRPDEVFAALRAWKDHF